MANEHQKTLTAILAAAGPLALLTFGLVPASLLKRDGRCAAKTGAFIALTTFGFALLATASGARGHAVDCQPLVVGAFHLGVYFDNLSAGLLALISFLLAVLTRYSVNYLAGDPAQGRFTKWLWLTGGSVLVIVISGKLASGMTFRHEPEFNSLGRKFTMPLAYGKSQFNFGHIS